MIWTIPKQWDGATVFILAGGPSLRGFDSSILRGKGRIITINDSWRLCPNADILYFCDQRWWLDQIGRNHWVKGWDGTQYNFHDRIYRSFWVTGSRQFVDHPQVRCIELTGQSGLEKNPKGVRHGSNSGYQAINLAYLLGAKKIVLLGYDMQCQGERTHWHNDSPHTAVGFETILKKSMLPMFDSLVNPLKEEGVEVINACPNSAIKVWPRMSLDYFFSPTLEEKPAFSESD